MTAGAGPPHELLDLSSTTGTFESWDEPIDSSGVTASYHAELRAAAERVRRRRVGAHRARAGRAADRWPSSSASSASWAGRSAGPPPSGSSRRYAGPPPSGCRCWPRPPPAAPACRRAPPRSWRWSAISRAVMAHKAAGLPYLVYLRHPTTGGVFASWGSLGHVTVAEPGALIGFLGPKVYEALDGTRSPPASRPAENLAAHGHHRRRRGRRGPPRAASTVTLAVLVDPAGRARRPGAADADLVARPAWDVGRADPPRRPARRPRAAALRRRGTVAAQRHRRGRAATRPMLALTRLDEQRACWSARTGRSSRRDPIGPGRAARGAARHTPGRGARAPARHRHRHPGRRPVPAAEEGALAGEIARAWPT